MPRQLNRSVSLFKIVSPTFRNFRCAPEQCFIRRQKRSFEKPCRHNINTTCFLFRIAFAEERGATNTWESRGLMTVSASSTNDSRGISKHNQQRSHRTDYTRRTISTNNTGQHHHLVSGSNSDNVVNMSTEIYRKGGGQLIFFWYNDHRCRYTQQISSLNVGNNMLWHKFKKKNYKINRNIIV